MGRISPYVRRALHLLALVATAAIGLGCTATSPPANDGGSSHVPSTGVGDGAPPSSGDGGARDGMAPPSGGARDALAPPSEASGSDSSSDASFDASLDARSDAITTSLGGGSCVLPDGGRVGLNRPDASLPGCGSWLSASASHAGISSPVQLTAAGRDAGFGSVLDWNVSGGSGSGQFTNTSVTSATFTCATPGWVVVTATDPSTPGCGGVGYDQASVAIQCEAFVGPWASVSVGAVSVCAVAMDGSAHCWGEESLNGVLGDGTTKPSVFPVQVWGLSSGISGVSVGNDFACAVTTGGAVQCWGAFPGLAGIGGITPAALMGLSSGVTAVSSAGGSACALTTSQGVRCWGDNSSGQLGDGSMNSSATPVAVAGLMGTTAAISVGGTLACAVSTTGTVQCWGDNASGELGPGADAGARSNPSPVAISGLPTSVTAVAAGSNFACALTSAGAVFCWGNNNLTGLSTSSSPIPAQVAGLPSNVASIAAGQDFACALTMSGGVFCWGSNVFGQLGNGVFPSSGPMASSGTPVPVSGLTSGVSAVSLGGESACALTSTGEILCWGRNDTGQLANPQTVFCGSGISPNPCSPVPLSIGAAAVVAPSCGGATGWCQQQSSPHTLCEDFDHGFPGQFTLQTSQASAGSMVGEDDGDYQSAPRSMLGITSPTAPLNVGSTAWATFVSPVAGANFQLQLDFKVGSDCFSNVSQAVTIARVDYLDVQYSLLYSVSPALSGAGFEIGLVESETTPQMPGPPGGSGVGSGIDIPPPADHWARLTASAHLGAGVSTEGSSMTLLEGNALPVGAGGGGILGPKQTPASAPVLSVGANAATHGCSVHIDNVLFDVQ